MTIDLSNRVAIVTGAGGGLGREHALALARRGAKVVVNDLGGSLDGKGGGTDAADRVVQEIRAAGGEAIANRASVTDFAQVEAMVTDATARWGSVDILVANAGILRDKTFAKMEIEDFRAVLEVHLMGSVHCAKAVWAGMRERAYGRIILTTSSSGLFGSFGQANYSAAKMGLVGLMHTLALEGAKYNIHVNCIAPTAGTRMLDGVFSEDQFAAFSPALVSPAVVALAAEGAPTKTVLCAGAGGFEISKIMLTKGAYLGNGADTPDRILAEMDRLKDMAGMMEPAEGADQYRHEFTMAGQARAKV